MSISNNIFQSVIWVSNVVSESQMSYLNLKWHFSKSHLSLKWGIWISMTFCKISFESQMRYMNLKVHFSKCHLRLIWGIWISKYIFKMSFETEIMYLSLKTHYSKGCLKHGIIFDPKYPDNIMLHETQILSSEPEMTPEIFGIWTTDGDIWVSDHLNKNVIWDLRFEIFDPWGAKKSQILSHVCLVFHVNNVFMVYCYTLPFIPLTFPSLASTPYALFIHISMPQHANILLISWSFQCMIYGRWAENGICCFLLFLVICYALPYIPFYLSFACQPLLISWSFEVDGQKMAFTAFRFF